MSLSYAHLSTCPITDKFLHKSMNHHKYSILRPWKLSRKNNKRFMDLFCTGKVLIESKCRVDSSTSLPRATLSIKLCQPSFFHLTLRSYLCKHTIHPAQYTLHWWALIHSEPTSQQLSPFRFTLYVLTLFPPTRNSLDQLIAHWYVDWKICSFIFLPDSISMQ